MLAAPTDRRLAAALRYANEVRARLGLADEPALRGGERVNPWFCPLCRTVGHDLARKYEVEFDGTVLRVWLRGTRLLWLEQEAPAEVVEWSEEFDRGRAGDEYALTREDARRP